MPICRVFVLFKNTIIIICLFAFRRPAPAIHLHQRLVITRKATLAKSKLICPKEMANGFVTILFEQQSIRGMKWKSCCAHLFKKKQKTAVFFFFVCAVFFSFCHLNFILNNIRYNFIFKNLFGKRLKKISVCVFFFFFKTIFFSLEQFRRVANLYFLLIAILQVCCFRCWFVGHLVVCLAAGSRFDEPGSCVQFFASACRHGCDHDQRRH